MFDDFILTSKKRKPQEFLAAIKREIKDWPRELDQDFIDYIILAENSESHRFDSIQTVCAEVVWPMMLNNYFLERENGKPVAYSSWGLFDPKIAKSKLRLHEELLVREDHGSGNELWLLDVIAPWGDARRMIRRLVQMKHDRGMGKHRVHFRRWYGERNLERLNDAIC